MRAIVMALFLLAGLFGAASACTSSTSKRFLWGMLMASFGLGLAVEVALEGYVGILVISVFLVTDVILYLYFRTHALLPAARVERSKADLIYRVSILWVILSSVAAGGLWIFSSDRARTTADAPALRMAALNEKVWGNDWLLIGVALFSISVMASGGFFLVRKEKG